MQMQIQVNLLHGSFKNEDLRLDMQGVLDKTNPLRVASDVLTHAGDIENLEQ